MNIQTIRRGDIWMVELKESYQYMLKGLHPCVVISNFKACNKSPIIQIIPISSKPKSMPMHVELEGCGLNKKSICLVEQITTINRDALRFQLGKVSFEKMQEIQEKVNMQLGFTSTYNIEMFQKIKEMLDELEELDRYLQAEYNDEIQEEREDLLSDLSRYCVNHSISLDLSKFYYGKRGEENVKAV